jgi:uncharacterized membrane protein
MGKSRLEAFSDGFFAIIITIMVLELKTPHEPTWEALRPLIPVLLSYVLSFIYLGIYWNNHHHLLQAVRHVDGRILWANSHLLFWLSLVPFVTGWMGETHFASLSLAFYVGVLLMAAISYTILALALVSRHGRDSTLARAMGRDFKGKFSIACYIAAIPLAFFYTPLSGALVVLVALIWLAPDRRIERALTGATE